MLEARIKTNLQKRDQDIMKFVCVYGGGEWWKMSPLLNTGSKQPSQKFLKSKKHHSLAQPGIQIGTKIVKFP